MLLSLAVPSAATARAHVQIPLAPPPAQPGGAWGVRVCAASACADQPPQLQLLPVKLGSPPPPSPALYQQQQERLDGRLTWRADGLERGTTLDMPAPASHLVLGPGQAYTYTDDASSESVATIPYGLTLGAGQRNGSLTLGGAVDAQALASPWTSAHAMPGLVAQGREAFRNVLVAGAPPSYRVQTVTLDFESEVVSIPAGAKTGTRCGQDLHVMFLQELDERTVTIPGALLSSPDRCRDAVDDASAHVVLGRPFFQAVYMFVEAEDRVRFAQASLEERDLESERLRKRSVPGASHAQTATATATATTATTTHGRSKWYWIGAWCLGMFWVTSL